MKLFNFILGKVLSGLVAAGSAVLLIGLWKLQILPGNLLLLASILLALLTALVAVLTWTGRGKVRMSIGIVLAVLLLAILTMGSVYIWQAVTTIDNITAGNTETVHVGIYIRGDDNRNFDDGAAGYQYGILQSIDRESTNGAVQQLNEKLKTQIACREYARPVDLVEALLNGEVDAIILNQAFLEVLGEMPGYEEKIANLREAVLHKVEVQVETPDKTEEPTTPGNDTEDPEPPAKSKAFTIYMSGIDTSGKVSVRSRSDVNILATVNPETRQILLVFTPRDYFVPLSISKGIPDKLTHAGIYGINVSRDTIGMLYGIDIDYHFKVNFSGFKKIVDALDGVTVYSEHTFSGIVDGEKVYFQKGANKLDGAQALQFCRVRKAFADGDNQRGRNQMAMIKAVLDKLMSPKLLTNYTQILKAVEGSFEMSMPMDVIGDLVSKQLSEGGEWNVVNYSVSGTGGYETTYSAAEELWVMYPDQKTVDYAKQLIQDVIDGKTVNP